MLIKQFTHALTWAPDPTKALEAFDQFLDLTVQETKGKAREEALAFLSDKKTFPLLARLLGASDFLWKTFSAASMITSCRYFTTIVTRLSSRRARRSARRSTARGPSKDDAGRKDALNRFKDQELFRIDMKHIVEPARASPTSRWH